MMIETIYNVMGIRSETCSSCVEAIKLVESRFEANIPLFKLIILNISESEKYVVLAATSISAFCAEHKIKKPLICCIIGSNELHDKQRNTLTAAGIDNFVSKPIKKA